MNRLEALSAAREHVAKVNAVPIKPNGYPLDGWKAATPDDVNRMILETAEFLLAGGETSSAAPATNATITARDILRVADALDNYREQGCILGSDALKLKADVMEILEAHEVEA